MRQSQVRRHFVHWQGLKRINIARSYGAALRSIEGGAISGTALTLSFFNQNPRALASSTWPASTRVSAHSGSRKALAFATAFQSPRNANQFLKAHPLPSQQIERVAVFIDGANLYAASRTLGFEVDYKNLLAHFRQRSYLVRAYYYTALLETEEYSPLRPLVDWLGYNGYSVVTKPAKEFTDATGRRRVKGNMDIELAVDVLALAPHLDHVVLFSGDGDFRRLVEAVQQCGVRGAVVSPLRAPPAMIADDLRRQADAFIDLADLT